MSTDVNKKRKDKRKKKAMLEALQQQEYLEERTRIGFNNDDEDEFILRPAEDEYELLVEPPVEHTGSGIGAKITFAILFGILAVIVGIVFFELGGGKSNISQIFEPIQQESVIESVYEEYVPKPVYESSSTTPTQFEDDGKGHVMDEKIPLEQDVRHEDELSEETVPTIEADKQVLPEGDNKVVEEEIPQEDVMAGEQITTTTTQEAVTADLPQEKISEIISDEIQTISPSTSEAVDQDLPEKDTSSPPASVEEPQQTVSSAEIVEGNLPEKDESSPTTSTQEHQQTVSSAEIDDEDLPGKDDSKVSADFEAPQETIFSPEVVTDDLPTQNEQIQSAPVETADRNPSQEDINEDNAKVIQPSNNIANGPVAKEEYEIVSGKLEVNKDSNVNSPNVQSHVTDTDPSLVSNDGTVTEQETESPAPLDESFTMRAEREAVQDAVDQVWVMTVRCLEELRALQSLARSSSTHNLVDKIRIRLEPLRQQLDQLVRETQNNIFDGALEQAAHLERSLAAVLNELEEARVADAASEEETPVEQVDDRDVRETDSLKQTTYEVDQTGTVAEQDEAIVDLNESKSADPEKVKVENPDLDEDTDDGEVREEDAEATEEGSLPNNSEPEREEAIEGEQQLLEATQSNSPNQDTEELSNIIDEEVLLKDVEEQKAGMDAKSLDSGNNDAKVLPTESQLIDELNEINSRVDEASPAA